MDFEKLLLEVQANRAGWLVAKPPVLQGISGVTHKFSFLASKWNVNQAFDIYDSVTDIEVLKSFLKKIDTGASVDVICAKGRCSSAAESLALEYNIRILKAEDPIIMIESVLMKVPSPVPA